MNVCARVVMLLLAPVLAVTTATAGSSDHRQAAAGADCQRVLMDYFESLPVNVLDGETIDALLLLREEEKMARDVYLTFTALYPLPVFSNIAWSEQNHMDLVAELLDRYGLEDPAAGKLIGEFTDGWVQETFDSLVALGKSSLIGALTAGAIVEDVDIFHLEHILEHSTFADVNVIVQNMEAGSRNHMRSFVGALEQREETYSATYIDQGMLDWILESPMETAVFYDENGDVLAACGQRP